MRFNFGSMLLASILATALMTAFMVYFDMNIVMALGKMAGFSGLKAYLVGGGIHLAVGVAYGIVYALVFEPLFRRMPGFVAGSIYSILPFVLALTMMGTFENWIRGVFDNPKGPTVDLCAPSGYSRGSKQSNTAPSQPYRFAPEEKKATGAPQSKQGAVPAKPQSKKENVPEKPSAPCEPEMAPNGACSPSNTSTAAMKVMDVPVTKEMFKLIGQGDQHDVPKYPVSPSQEVTPQPYSKIIDSKSDDEFDKSDIPGWAWTLFNHMIYGFFLGLFYFPRKRRSHLDEL